MMKSSFRFVLIVVVLVVNLFEIYGSNASRIECNKRYYEQFMPDSFVCVCNSTYCDTIEPVDNQDEDLYFQEYVTSKNLYRLDKFKQKFDQQPLNGTNFKLVVNRNVTYQQIKGFGGAITDSAGLNIYSLSLKASQNLINSYFHETGIEYNILRVPVGGADFSTRQYTYDDVPNDFNLTKFSLADEDLKFKIPFIQSAQSISKKPIYVFASAWTAPPWMKTNNDYKGNATLIGPVGGLYYQIWAEYYLKFFQAYEQLNVTFWAMTGQNEPSDGFLYKFGFNSMGFTPESQAVFITQNLGPLLRKNGFDYIKIMILDDQRLFLPGWAERVFKYSPDAPTYVDGIAVHWYLDSVVNPKVLDMTHDLFPDKWILATEGCIGAGPFRPHVILGSFSRAESYAKFILQDLNHWVVGWTDWNLALDLEGGPNWDSNFVDSPLIVNKTSDEFYKQPIFYILGHFSKFIPELSVRVEVTNDSGQQINDKLTYVSFYEKNSRQTIFIILNEGETTFNVALYDPELDKYLNLAIESHSIKTLVWFN